jgi:hypothetical protein
MAPRTALRLVVDASFALAIVVCGVLVYKMTRSPTIPRELCPTEQGGPRYAEMLDDGQLTIAVVFGELEGGPADPNAWSFRAFETGLRERGFVEIAPERFRRDNTIIDIALIADDPEQTSAALTGAFASHDVVYYNGHSHKGAIELAPGAAYRLIVLDSCWSTQHFAKRLLDRGHDVITNSERSVTGSVESFFVLIDVLLAREPRWPLAEMNELAERRAAQRAPLSTFRVPERYRIDTRCK